MKSLVANEVLSKIIKQARSKQNKKLIASIRKSVDTETLTETNGDEWDCGSRSETKLERFPIIVTITNGNSDKLTHFQRIHRFLYYILMLRTCEIASSTKKRPCSLTNVPILMKTFSLISDGAFTSRIDFSVSKADKVSLLSPQSAHLFVAWMRYSTGNWRFCSKESTGTETNNLLTNTVAKP